MVQVQSQQVRPGHVASLSPVLMIWFSRLHFFCTTSHARTSASALRTFCRANVVLLVQTLGASDCWRWPFGLISVFPSFLYCSCCSRSGFRLLGCACECTTGRSFHAVRVRHEGVSLRMRVLFARGQLVSPLVVVLPARRRWLVAVFVSLNLRAFLVHLSWWCAGGGAAAAAAVVTVNAGTSTKTTRK